jgi:hypothetical protein
LAWKLLRFPEAIDAWVQREAPKDDVRLMVLDWVMGRHDDPYLGMRREVDFGNLWFGPIPGTQADGAVVTCSYWVYEATRIVRCNAISTLSLPI